MSLTEQFKSMLKHRIDVSSYPRIMEVFSELLGADTCFTSSLLNFKICIDSLMHSLTFTENTSETGVASNFPSTDTAGLLTSKSNATRSRLYSKPTDNIVTAPFNEKQVEK